MIGLGRVRRQVEGGEDGAEKQPRAEPARHQIGVLALPADAGRGGQRLFHHRGGVDEHLHVAARLRDEPARQVLEALLDDVVIVVALGIDRDRAAIAGGEDGHGIAFRTIIHAEHDDGPHLRPHQAGIAAAFRVRRHPPHVAVLAFVEEPGEPGARLRGDFGPRHRDGIEAEGGGGLDQGGFEVGGAGCGAAQKSRSA